MCDVRLRDIRDVWRARDLGFHSVVAGALPLMDPNLRTEEPELHGNPKLSPETNPGPNLVFSPDPSPDPSPSPSFNLDQVRCCSRPVRATAWNLPCSSRRGSATLTPAPCCIVHHAASLTMLHALLSPLSLIMLHPLTMLQPPTMAYLLIMLHHAGNARKGVRRVRWRCRQGSMLEVPLASGSPCGHPPLQRPACLLRKCTSL